MDYYNHTLQNPRVDFALDKTLMEKGENFFSYCTVQKSVLIGGDIPITCFNETNEGVILARHFAGGGPIYSDEGNIKASFLLDKVDLNKTVGIDDYGEICKQWIMKSLKDLGVETTTENGENDIFLNGKKISGVSTKDMGDKFFVAFIVTLFIDFEMASRVVNLTKHTTNLAERAIGINQVLENPISSEQILASFKRNLNELWGVELQDPADVSLLPDFQKNIEIFNDDDWIKYGRDTHDKPDFK